MFQRATQGKQLLDDAPLVDVQPFRPVLNAAAEFWMKLLDVLPNEILAECEMDSSHQRLGDLLRIYHSGIVWVLLHMPSHLYSFNLTIYKALRDALESSNFWQYNPIRLVSILLWSVSLHDKAEEVLESSMPFTADTLAELLPLTEAPEIQESDVFCQEAALDFVNSAMQTGREAQPFLNFLLSAFVPPLFDFSGGQL